MKRQSRKSPRTKTPQSQTNGPARKRIQSRRQFLTNAALYGMGGTVLLGGGGALALDFRTKLAESDLSRLGQGVPTVVQIHDPQCSMCQELQRETRTALNNCDQDGIQYLVANIRATDGAEFANKLRLPHVTLALFDEHGTHVHTVSGVTPAETLKQVFIEHLGSQRA